DEAGAERIGLVRLQFVVAAALAARPPAVLEEVVEELLKRRTRRQLRHRALAVALGLDGLRRRDVDHCVDHLLRHVGDAFGATRRSESDPPPPSRCRPRAGCCPALPPRFSWPCASTPGLTRIANLQVQTGCPHR